MLGLNEQTAAAPIAQFLRGTETEFCRLRAQREAIEIRLTEPSAKEDSSRTALLRAELRSLGEQMAHVQIEMLSHRISLLKEQLPADKAAIAPAQSTVDQANLRYEAAAHERDVAGAELHNARTRVGCAEANISFYERSIEELKQKLASKGNTERSVGEIASEVSSLEKRLGQLKTISSRLSTGG